MRIICSARDRRPSGTHGIVGTRATSAVRQVFARRGPVVLLGQADRISIHRDLLSEHTVLPQVVGLARLARRCQHPC